MASIFLIRHGQASFGTDNYDRLSELGCRQSEVLGRYLVHHDIHFDAVYSGELQRLLYNKNKVSLSYYNDHSFLDVLGRQSGEALISYR